MGKWEEEVEPSELITVAHPRPCRGSPPRGNGPRGLGARRARGLAHAALAASAWLTSGTTTRRSWPPRSLARPRSAARQPAPPQRLVPSAAAFLDAALPRRGGRDHGGLPSARDSTQPRGDPPRHGDPAAASSAGARAPVRGCEAPRAPDRVASSLHCSDPTWARGSRHGPTGSRAGTRPPWRRRLGAPPGLLAAAVWGWELGFGNPSPWPYIWPTSPTPNWA